MCVISTDIWLLHLSSSITTTYLNKPKPPHLHSEHLTDPSLPLSAKEINSTQRGGGRGWHLCWEGFA